MDIMDIFLDILLKPPQPLIGLFLSFRPKSGVSTRRIMDILRTALQPHVFWYFLYILSI